MASTEDASTTAASSTPVAERRVAFERLRERTDELELIISGISLVALVSLPGWLFDQWVRLEVHVDGRRGLFVEFGVPLAIGLCYTLAGAFLIHLVARAYWVGLIGLKWVFPKGIRWDRVTSQGPLMREWLSARFSDLDPFIDASDRFASTVFALVSLVALSFVWVVMPLAALAIALDVASRFTSIPDTLAATIFTSFFIVLASISLPLYVLDRVAGAMMHKGRRPWPALIAVLRFLTRLQGWFYPQRLLLPVQLIFESNLPRRTFSIAFGTIIMFTTLIGVTQLSTARQFTVMGEYAFATSDDVAGGLRTAHYESLRSANDALLREPVIPSDLIADPYLRLFLPYVPSRDNDVLKKRCSPGGGDRSAEHRACVAALWTVTLDGAPVDVAAFDFAERRDLGMRGLQGYLSTGALTPGRHELLVGWSTGSEQKERNLRARRFRIPFWFAPPYQLDYTPPESTPPRLDVVPSAPAPAAEDGSEGKVD